MVVVVSNKDRRLRIESIGDTTKLSLQHDKQYVLQKISTSEPRKNGREHKNQEYHSGLCHCC